MKRIEEIQKKIQSVDKDAMENCKLVLKTRMKPEKSLGILEELAIKVAGITGETFNSLSEGCHF
ncbi:MAG: nicotinate-nucleotide--dimethylbenzimidazole phosphoribosyltransferase, partial [Cetobacterium sp.]